MHKLRTRQIIKLAKGQNTPFSGPRVQQPAPAGAGLYGVLVVLSRLSETMPSIGPTCLSRSQQWASGRERTRCSYEPSDSQTALHHIRSRRVPGAVILVGASSDLVWPTTGGPSGQAGPP